MQRKILYMIPLVLVLLSGLFIKHGISLAASQAETTQSSGFTNLTLKISTPKEEVFELEPVPIALELTNETSGPVTGHTALGFSLNHVKLFVGQSGRKMEEVRELSPSRERVHVSTQRIAPGERHLSNQFLTLNLNEIFPRPGVYEIEAVLYDAEWQEKIKSNIATVKILKPEGNNKEAFEFIKGKPSAPYFFSVLEISGDAEALRTIEEFEANYSESAYGDYASFQLGRFYFFREEYPKAKERLEKVAKKKGFMLADVAADYLAKIRKATDAGRH